MSSKFSHMLILAVIIASLLTLIVNGSPEPQATITDLTTTGTPSTISKSSTESLSPTIVSDSMNTSGTSTAKSTSNTSAANSLQLLPRTLYVIGLLTFVFELFLILA
ncbi:hypothetical protein Glove_217g45 [Diversispora epigaea]|uniref:Uncharacterized protein n=1 Tax=Diversispora epigaea TaxID=1348612 RepID=A0A397IJJ1_9GLOM|nr:hypothetical protein Glove_217g45 [Diversispora epigaea]